jgi:hypothetical protein
VRFQHAEATVQGLEGLWQWSGTGTRASLALAASQTVLHMCVVA